MNGVPMVEIRDQLSHSSVQITEQYYAHLHLDYHKKADKFTDGLMGRVAS